MEVLRFWDLVYSEISRKLDLFYIEHKENTPIEFYRRLKSSNFAVNNKNRLFNENLNLKEEGIDPVQIFAAFSYAGIKLEKRIEIINSLLEPLDSKFRVDETTSFEGCPSPIITQIIKFRGWKVQNEIWKMFHQIVSNNLDGLTSSHFNFLQEWEGLQITSFTIFLFWIDSNVFMPLDKGTVNFLTHFNVINSRPKNYDDYILLCRKIQNLDVVDKTGLIRAIVKDSYKFSRKDTGQITLNPITAKALNIKSDIEKSEILDKTDIAGAPTTETVIEKSEIEKSDGKGITINRVKQAEFKIIAIRPLKSIIVNNELETLDLKNLALNKFYILNNAYLFGNESDTEIDYEETSDLNIYNTEKLNISISAVVGKNGSGKSTIVEVLYAIINKISKKKNIISTDELDDLNLYADLYFKTDKLCKLSVSDKIKLFEYKFEKDKYIIDTPEEDAEELFNNYDIEKFCYSLVLNYSLYGFNSNILGDWIIPLFHKNDSYQVPIVLNPKRTKGIIDVNTEDELAKARTLANILEPDFIDFDNKLIPELLENTKPLKLTLELDALKIESKRERYKNRIDNVKISKFVSLFKISQRNDIEYANEAMEYIFIKALSIADIYPQYDEFKNMDVWIDNSIKMILYAEELLKDTSHVTFKLRQALNYLEHGIYNTKNENKIIDLAEKIDLIRIANSSIYSSRTIDLIPPSFLKIDILFDNKGYFNLLSSGEKQHIYSIINRLVK